MHILLTGASGLVGQGALADSAVTQVTALVRAPLGIAGGKVCGVLCSDLFQIATVAGQLGEPAITHWHASDESPEACKPLDARFHRSDRERLN